jgi:hypothetical protein
MIGGIAGTQGVVHDCAVKPILNLIRPKYINRAERAVKQDVRFRFAIDMASARA